MPEDSLDRSFLEDPIPQREKGRPVTKTRVDSDSDRDASGGNPMVAAFQDDLDLDDCILGRPAAELIPSKDIALSSEEEEEGEKPSSEHLVLEPEAKWSSQKVLQPLKPAAPTKATDPKPPAGLPPQPGCEQNGTVKLPTVSAAPAGAVPPHHPKASSHKLSTSKLKGARPEESDSEPEGPIATQMLSFVMDDPDFESEESDSQRKADAFPMREDLSDVSDDEASSKPPQVAKPVMHSFKPTNESDLFGLGLADPGPKKSSGEDKEENILKEKKKKKKKSSKEEEEKNTTKKSSKHRKGKEKEEGKEEKDRKKKKRSKDQGKEIDELEAFLGGGGVGSSKQLGGGDYEEL